MRRSAPPHDFSAKNQGPGPRFGLRFMLMRAGGMQSARDRCDIVWMIAKRAFASSLRPGVGTGWVLAKQRPHPAPSLTCRRQLHQEDRLMKAPAEPSSVRLPEPPGDGKGGAAGTESDKVDASAWGWRGTRLPESRQARPRYALGISGERCFGDLRFRKYPSGSNDLAQVRKDHSISNVRTMWRMPAGHAMRFAIDLPIQWHGQTRFGGLRGPTGAIVPCPPAGGHSATPQKAMYSKGLRQRARSTMARARRVRLTQSGTTP